MDHPLPAMVWRERDAAQQAFGELPIGDLQNLPPYEVPECFGIFPGYRKEFIHMSHIYSPLPLLKATLTSAPY